MKEIRFETDCPQEGIHLHEELEVLYALTGRVGVTVGGWHFVLEPEGVAVFNPFEPHELNKEPGGHTLSLYVPIGPLKQAGLGRVACCSALHPEKAVYLEFLREKLATLFLEYQNPDGTFSFRLSCLYALLGVLQQGFGGDSHAYSVSEADISWLREVLSYVQDNLGEDLSRQAVAQHFFLSPGYLSRKFQQLTGVVFSEFVRDMRLNMAEGLLLHSHKSVTEIAVQSGFAFPNSFIYTFQQHFGCTPGKYRRLHRAAPVPNAAQRDVSYMSLTRHASRDDRSLLFSKTLDGGQAVPVNARRKGAPLRLPHNRALGAGYASDLLLEPIRNALRRAVKEVGCQYIAFHGILNSAMNLYQTDPDGNLRLNFNYADMVLDFILSTGAAPWMGLDYTPPELVKGEKNFFGSSCMSLPSDLARWEEVIMALLSHFVERYGMKEVQTWHFFMEQALYEFYGVFTLEEYQKFYFATYQAIRQVVPGAYITGFGLDMGICTLPGNKALPRMLAFCRENGCLPDELVFQNFGCDYASIDLPTAEKELVDHRQDQMEEPVPVSYDPDVVRHQAEAVRKVLCEEGFAELPLSLSMMASTIWQRDLGNDTCFKAAWIVKNVLENADLFLGASVSLTEFTERTLMNPNVFHGGHGVVSFLGFPKAGYHALALLSRFYGQVIAQGEGYMATRTEEGDGITLMLYHYCHYDRDTHLTRQLPTEEQRIYDRYYGFEKKGPRSFHFVLEALEPGSYEMHTRLVNRNFGSAYDIWMEMGAPERVTLPQQEYLNRIAIPKYQFKNYRVDESGRLLFSVLLEPHEVRLIHLRKK